MKKIGICPNGIQKPKNDKSTFCELVTDNCLLITEKLCVIF